MSNQATVFVTIIEETIFDDVPAAEHRQYLNSNGFIRTGKVWKRIRRIPAKRMAEAEVVKAIEPIA